MAASWPKGIGTRGQQLAFDYNKRSPVALYPAGSIS